VSLVKVLTEFTKTADVLEFRAGLVDGVPVRAPSQAIADLPSREVLIGKLLYLLQTPITRLVRDLERSRSSSCRSSIRSDSRRKPSSGPAPRRRLARVEGRDPERPIARARRKTDGNRSRRADPADRRA
jgi:hypothetical protein